MGVAGPPGGTLHPPDGRAAIIAELGTLALETNDLDVLFRAACKRLATTLETRYSNILQLVPDDETMVLRAGVGWRDDLVGSMTVPPDRSSQMGHTLCTEEPIVVDDLRTEERFSGSDLLTDHEIVSGLSILIGSVEDPWGVLGVHTTDSRAFDADDVSFVQCVANILASAVRNHRARRSLREGDEQFRELVEHVETYAIFRLDPHGNVRTWNEGAETIKGYTKADILGNHVSIFYPDEDVEAGLPEQLLAEAAESGQAEHEGWRVRKDGSTFWASVSITALYDDDGEVRGYTKITQDLTERKEREAELERMADLLDHAEPAADIGGWELDVRNGELYFTSHLRHLLDLSGADRYQLEEVMDAYHEEDRPRLEAAFDAALNEGEPIDLEARHPTPNDGIRWLHIQGVPETEGDELVRVRGSIEDITDQKARQAELDRTVDLLHHTEGIADVGGWEIDPDAWELFCTDHVLDLFDVDTRPDLPLDKVLGSFHPDDRAEVASVVETSIEHAEPFDIEARVQAPGDDVRWLHIQGVPETEGDEVSCLRGAVQDITERKAREETLQRDSAIIDALGDPVYALDAEGRITFVNEALTEWCGYAADELLGEHVSTALPDGQIDRVKSVIAELLANDPTASAHVEFEGVTKTGEHRVVENHISVLTDDTGAFAGSAGGLRDITERKERERTLAQYRALTEAANDVILTIDASSTIQTVNPAVEEVFGYTPDELRDESLTTLMPDDLGRRHVNAIEQYLETDERNIDWEYIELPGEHADGEAIPLAISFSEVEFEGERFFTGVIRDITERKEYERELEESHERLEQFATAVSHDLREPLGAVSSYLQLLERRYEDELDEDAEEFIQFAVGGATRMREMIDGLVTAYGRVDTEGDPFAPVDLDAVVQNVLVDMQRTIDESDARITASALPEVEGDRSQLYQLVMNLLDNAIKYAGDGPPRIDISADQGDEEWVIAVSDEGIGMEPEATEEIFDVFHRLHDNDERYPGTGIGLALCERIVERHGGEIWVESEPGNGSTFFFTIPCEQSLG